MTRHHDPQSAAPRSSLSLWAASQPRRVLFQSPARLDLCALLVADGWVLAGPGDVPDVVVCFDLSRVELVREFPNAGIILMLSKGDTSAMEGVDVVLLDPTPNEFLTTCDWALRRGRARSVSSEYITDILECNEDAFFVLDWDRCVAYQNRQALVTIAAYEGGNGDILGLPLGDHVADELRVPLSLAIDEVLLDMEPRTFETHGVSSGDWSGANVYFIPGGAAVYLRNITARKAAESAEAASRERTALRAVLALSTATPSAAHSLHAALDSALAAGRVDERLAELIRTIIQEGTSARQVCRTTVDPKAAERSVGETRA